MAEVEEELLEKPPKPAPPKRLKWERHAEYILSSIGYSVGLLNVWRFPYVCYKNGGAAFLFPYILLLIIVGLPIYFMETVLGQFPSKSTVPAFCLVPVAKGVGFTQILVACVFCSYYAVILVWSLKYFYFGLSLFPLPWTSCEGNWGQHVNSCYVKTKEDPDPPMCFSKKHQKALESDPEAPCKNWTTASNQFFNIYILQSGNSNFPNIGSIRPDTALVLALVWFVIFLCISKGIQTSGKVVYFTAIFPYIVLVYICIVGFSMPGAVNGMKYLFIPEMVKLLDIQVWQAALSQMFMSTGVGVGCIIMYASFNPLENKLFRDSIIVTLVDLATSILASVAVFSVIGFYSEHLGEEFDKVFRPGIGLFFEVLPDAITEMPYPKLGTLLLFMMIFTLGIDSQFVFVETIVAMFEDEFPKVLKYKTILRLIVCTTGTLVGLVYCTEGGLLMVILMDKCNEIIVTYSVFWETFAVIYLYGINRLADDMFFMNGYRLGWIYRICLAILDPIIVAILFFVGIIKMEALKEKDGFVWWANYIVLAVALCVMAPVPGYAIYSTIRAFKKKATCSAYVPDPDWGPAEAEYKFLYNVWTSDRVYKSNTILQLIFKQPFPKKMPLSPEVENKALPE